MKGSAFCAVFAVLLLYPGAVKPYEDDDDDTTAYHDYEAYETRIASVTRQFISSSIELTAVVGETVILPCDAEIPEDATFWWEKKDPIYNTVSNISSLTNDRVQNVNKTSLQLSSVVPTDSGYYSCHIETEPAMELKHRLQVTSRLSHPHQCAGKSIKWIDLSGDYCYLIEQEKELTFIEAVYQCFQEGGHLATLPTIEEVKRIRSYLQNTHKTLHIGLWKHNDGSFEWVDHNPSNFRNWNGGEPNERNEYCVEMYPGSGKWNDIFCRTKSGYICSSLKSQTEPVPRKVCPTSSSDWKDYGSEYCYIIELYNETTSQGAAERCSSAGGTLASFHSVEEISVVREHIRHHHDRLHIGFRQNGDEMFEWMDRSPVDLEFWDTREPNDVDEQCAEIYPSNGYWNDIPCDKIEGYICSTPKVNPEIPATETPPSSGAELCGGDLTAESGTIHSPNYPESYNPNENCIWNITVPETFQIELHFQALQLEYGVDCDFDYVEVRDGGEPDSTVLRKLCGSNAPQTILSAGNKVVVKFSSDRMNQRSGFFAEFKKVAQCGGSIVGEQGVIQTPNYPDNYKSNEVCIWKITVPENNAVLLKFEAFEVEDSYDCKKDYVEILDGHDPTSDILLRKCGIYNPGEIFSSGHKITVRFMSDDSKEYYGFSAEFKKVEAGAFVISTDPPVTAQEACKSSIDYKNGLLTSPHYPEKYGYDEECTWTLTAPPGSTISLRFKMFQIENAPCTYDFITVHDGPKVSSSSLGKYCGKEVPDLITSSSNQMTVHFETDSSGVYRGFTALIETSDGSNIALKEAEKGPCGQDIAADEGVIQSPNYPANYGSSEKCSWKITVPNGHQVVLKFSDFKLETHVGCAYDYVLVRDGHTPRSRVLARLCGFEIPNEIRSSQSELMIEFKSDSSTEHSGFSAEFEKDLPVAPNVTVSQNFSVCGGHIYAKNGTIHSPNYPSEYGPNEECIWKIRVPESHLVSLKFESIQLEYSPSCNFEQITVQDGHNIDSPVLYHFCSDDVKNIVSSGNMVTVNFTSDDSFEASGFTATFQTVFLCGGNISADTGVLQSPNITGAYQCTWRISAPQNYTVLLEIPQNEKQSYTYGSFFVEVHDGLDRIDNVISFLSFLEYNYTIHSTLNEMLVLVTSDGSEGLPQFFAEFRKVFTETCEEDIVADSGIITSPNYPKHYDSSEDCIWKITVPENYRVRFTFQTFALEGTSCNYDFVEIRDGHSSHSALLGRFCGTSLPDNLLSTSNKMSLRFVSDSSIQYQGFLAQFEKVSFEGTESCGGKITAETGVISSPKFPDNYPKNSACTWKITVPEDSTVTLQFNSFDMEDSDNCLYDSVEIFDGHDELNAELLGRYCGNTVPHVIHSTTNEISVTFTSDSSRETKGFTAEFSKAPASHPGVEELLRQLPNIISEYKQQKSKASRGKNNKKKTSVVKRSVLETLHATFKLR